MGKRREGREEKKKGSKGGGYGKVNDGATKIVVEEATDGAHTIVAIEEEAVVMATTGAIKGPKAGADESLSTTIKVNC